MLLQAVINGLLFGAVYATIGIGFSLVWGVMNIINVAHGSFIMVGAYLSYTLYSAYGLDPFLSIPVVMLALFILAYVIQRFVLNRVVRGNVFITLTFTFGLQILGLDVPREFILMLPYVAVILLLCILARNTKLPGAFCIPYERE